MEEEKKTGNDMELGLEFAPEKKDSLRRAEERWQQFLRTGSVADYLNYAAVSREENVPMHIK